MKKLSVELIRESLLSESEEVKASYDKIKVPDGKSKEVGVPKDMSTRKDSIPQVDVPTEKKMSTKKSGGQSFSTTDRADSLVSKMATPGWSKNKKDRAVKTPAVQKNKPNQTAKLSPVANPLSASAASKKKGMNIPASEEASVIINRMPTGGNTLGAGSNKTPEVKPAPAAKLNGTTSPSKSEVKVKSKEVGSQRVDQVVHTGKKMKGAPGEPAKPTWEKHVKGHNVMESVVVSLNGKSKASFDILNGDVAHKLVETYERLGYQVELVKGDKPAWKSDKAFLTAIFESVDAYYNNAPQSSKSARKTAMNRLLQLSQNDFNKLYESKRQFVGTVKDAFDKIMENADSKYRQSLVIVEGLARVVINGETHDIDMITQARDEQMALRQFRNEIVEEYGFNVTIKHMFIDGNKHTLQDIVEWAPKSKK